MPSPPETEVDRGIYDSGVAIRVQITLIEDDLLAVVTITKPAKDCIQWTECHLTVQKGSTSGVVRLLKDVVLGGGFNQGQNHEFLT